MPRTADHEQRRRQVADALLRVVSAEGLDAASIPRVARAAGTSTGLVQRYFATKDDLLRFAFDHLLRLVGERIAAALAEVGPEAGTADRLYAALATFLLPAALPGDPEGRVWLAFLARAAVEPDLLRLHVTNTDLLRTEVAGAVRAGQASGESPADLDPEEEAVALVAVLDGLTVHVVLEPQTMTTDRALAVLRRELDRLFPPSDPEERP